MQVESEYWGNRLVAQDATDVAKLVQIEQALEGVSLGGYDDDPEPVKVEHNGVTGRYNLEIGR